MIIPIVLTLAILWWMAIGAERLLGKILTSMLPEGWYIPGMGLVAGLAVVILIGLLSHVLIFQKLLELGEQIVKRVPLVKSIYTAIKDFIDYLNVDTSKRPQKVVMVTFPDQDMQLLGFVTREQFDDLALPLDMQEPVAVYLPMSYQIGGYTLFIPRQRITPVDIPFEEAMRLILTGAVHQPDGQSDSIGQDRS